MKTLFLISILSFSGCVSTCPKNASWHFVSKSGEIILKNLNGECGEILIYEKSGKLIYRGAGPLHKANEAKDLKSNKEFSYAFEGEDVVLINPNGELFRLTPMTNPQE